MKGIEIRDRIYADHALLRGMLDEIEEFSGRFEQGESPAGDMLRERGVALYSRFSEHLDFEDAIRRLTSFPAATLRLPDRGLLKPGYVADIVAFDAATIRDHATFESPHQYATGVRHVWVNGTAVLEDGEHTGATPGQVVRGPGYQR